MFLASEMNLRKAALKVCLLASHFEGKDSGSSGVLDLLECPDREDDAEGVVSLGEC